MWGKVKTCDKHSKMGFCRKDSATFLTSPNCTSVLNVFHLRFDVLNSSDAASWWVMSVMLNHNKTSRFGFQREYLILLNTESSSLEYFYTPAYLLKKQLNMVALLFKPALLDWGSHQVTTWGHFLNSSRGTEPWRVLWFVFGQQIVIFKLHPSDTLLLLLPLSVVLCPALPSHFCALCGTAHRTCGSCLSLTCTHTAARKERHRWCVFGFSWSMRQKTRRKRDGHSSWTFILPAPGWMLAARRVVCTCSGAFAAFLRGV